MTVGADETTPPDPAIIDASNSDASTPPDPAAIDISPHPNPADQGDDDPEVKIAPERLAAMYRERGIPEDLEVKLEFQIGIGGR